MSHLNGPVENSVGIIYHECANFQARLNLRVSAALKLIQNLIFMIIKNQVLF